MGEGRLTLYEQETVMLSNRSEKEAMLSTTKPSDIKYYKKLAAENPDEVKIVHEDEYGIKITFPRKWMKRARPPKAMSQETKEKLLTALEEGRRKRKDKKKEEEEI